MKLQTNIFEAQELKEEQENDIIRNNILIDLYYGNNKIVRDFVQKNPRITDCRNFEQYGYNRLDFARKNSLFMTVMMLTGQCEADCEVCYTDRRKNHQGLIRSEIIEVLNQTSLLGSRLLYIPGEGEPILDDAFWVMLEHAKKVGMEVVIFTNGILLSNDSYARKRWGISADEIVSRLLRFPTYIYHKLWSLDPEKHAEMMGISMNLFEWTRLSAGSKTYFVPKGLVRLIERFPRNRVGIQVIAERRNFHELSSKIIPFIQELSIKSYIEPILHSGRMRGRKDLDLTDSELQSFGPWISRKECRRIAHKIVVHNDGTLSPGMGFKPTDLKIIQENINEYSIRNAEGQIRDIFSLIHQNQFFVWSRYQIEGCLCERINHCVDKMSLRVEEMPQMLFPWQSI